jgi:hypothetical protein
MCISRAKHGAKAQGSKAELTPRCEGTYGRNRWVVPFDRQGLYFEQGQESAKVVQTFFVPSTEVVVRKLRVRRERGLRVNEAAEIEVEEGVGVGVEADLGIGRARVGAGETFFVDADVHGLDRAESGIDDEGDGHGVEERGGFLAPLVVEQGEGIGDGGALAEEEGALDLVHFQLRGVERHDKEGYARGKELLSRGDVIEDVPFRLRALQRAVAEVAVAALDGAAHQNNALELSKGRWVFVYGGADVQQGSDGDQGNLIWVTVDLFEKESDSIGMRGLREVAALGIAALGERSLGRGRQSGRNRYVGTPRFSQETIQKLGAGLGVAEGRGDTYDLQFGAAQG